MLTTKSIESRLHAKLAPIYLEVLDESAQHAGHAEAKKSGGGHFRLLLVSPHFTGKSRLARQRLIFAALSDNDQAPALHAVSMLLYSPEEWAANAN